MPDGQDVRVTKSRRTHTFGACDTCRRRHVKCDQARPTCLKCKASGVQCTGYRTDLKWVTSDGKGDGFQGTRPFSESRLSTYSGVQPHLENRPVVDSILELDARSKSPSTANNGCHIIGPFGVLKFGNSRQSVPSSLPASERNLEVNNASGDPRDIVSPYETQSLNSFLNVNDVLDWPDLLELDFAWPDPVSTDFGWNQSQIDFRVASLPIPDQFAAGPQNILVEAENRFVQPDLPPLSAAFNSPGMSLRGISSVDAQLLLKHFSDHVVPHFSSLPVGEKSHWTILNVRSAILTLANITYMHAASTSNAAMANLMALLAMSACHFAHQSAVSSSDDVSRWGGIGKLALQYAKEHLQCSLSTEVRGPSRAKYKDQLMALSAMLAFAVLYDRQQDARAYMIDTERLVRIRGLAKRTISRKSRILHHIYTWSRILGESSYVLRSQDSSQISSAAVASSLKRKRGERSGDGPVSIDLRYGQSSKLDNFLRLEQDASESDVETDAQKESETALRDIHLEDPRNDPASMFLQLYGISETWLCLVSQTTRLANITESLDKGELRQDNELWESIERRKQRLENVICTFAANNTPKSTRTSHQVGDQPLQENGMETPRSCMVRALNSALVIFFYRRIRNVHPWILQEHVEKVVQALQDFDVSRKMVGIEGPGSPWPVLMAGCEASSKHCRDYLSGWLDHAFDKTGFDRFKAIKSCMWEVWEKRDRRKQRNEKGLRNNLWSWVHVSREQNIYLLLS